MVKKKKSRFKGKVGTAMKRSASGATYGYLSLPKGVSMFSAPPGGRINMDILPYKITMKKHPDKIEDEEVALLGDLWHRRPFKIHRNIGASKDSYVCPIPEGGKCPICEYAIKRKGEGADKEELNALRASQRNLYIVKIINNEKWDDEFYLWDFSHYLFEEALQEEIQENEDFEIFPDLEDGLTLSIRFSKEKFGGNTFAKTTRIDFKDRKKQYDESIVEDLPKLDELLIVKSYNELDEIFFQLSDDVDEDDVIIVDEDEDEDDIEEEPKKRKKKTTETKKNKKKDKPEVILEDNEMVCIACEGSGENTRGRECPICKGTGVVKKKSTSDDDELPKKKKKKCPHGHKFGVDTETKDDCDKCKVWENCIAVKEANMDKVDKKKKKK